MAERRIGLIGDNGSGKSTLLRLVNGLARPTRGRVVTAGLDTVRQRKELPARVGFLFQNPDHQLIFPTVAEEIAFGPSERGLPAAQAHEQALALALLARHGCADWAGRNVNELSGGQKQLVCILALLATEPSILLMDEPFASLDLPTRLLLMLLLADLVCMTTTMSALMAALAPVLRCLRPLGVNSRKLAVAVAVALVLRFVPVLLTRWRARGGLEGAHPPAHPAPAGGCARR